MSKEKKKKKGKNKEKDSIGAGRGEAKVSARKPKKSTARLKSLTDNPIVADIAAAALVAMAAALKDPRKAREMAQSAGGELKKLQAPGSGRGNAMWELALEIGRRALSTAEAEPTKKKKEKAAAKPVSSKS